MQSVKSKRFVIVAVETPPWSKMIESDMSTAISLKRLILELLKTHPFFN